MENERRRAFPFEPVDQATAQDILQLYLAFLFSDETRNPSSIKMEPNRIGIGDRTRLNRGTLRVFVSPEVKAIDSPVVNHPADRQPNVGSPTNTSTSGC